MSALKIAIDAGHGLHTAGKRCPDDSMREFHFNSVVARYVRDELAQYSGAAVLFTHADDGSRDVPLDDRFQAALKWGADVFVSVHANAFGSGWNDSNGIETFTTTDKNAPSVRLAAAAQSKLIAATGRRDRGVKAADFRVIWGTAAYREKVPARVLVECGFMTNREEAALLKSDEYRRKCAAAICSAIAEVYGLSRKVERKMNANDAEKIIRFLSAAWFTTENAEARAEFARLADEVRKVAGIKT